MEKSTQKAKNQIPNTTRIKQKSTNISIPKFKNPLSIPKSLMDLIDEVDINPDGSLSTCPQWLKTLQENLENDPESNKMIIDILKTTSSSLQKSQKDKIEIFLNILERGETGNIIKKSDLAKKKKPDFREKNENLDFFSEEQTTTNRVNLLDLNRYNKLSSEDPEMEKSKEKSKNQNFGYNPPIYQFSPVMDILEHKKRVQGYSDLGVWFDGKKVGEKKSEDIILSELGGMREDARPVGIEVLRDLVNFSLV